MTRIREEEEDSNTTNTIKTKQKLQTSPEDVEMHLLLSHSN